MVLQGRDLIIKANGVVIAMSRSCSIDVNCATIPVSSPDDGEWEHSITGLKSWSVKTNHLILATHDFLLKTGDTVTLTTALTGGNPFGGFIDNPTLEPFSTVVEHPIILWDTTRKTFIASNGAILNPKYYLNWGTVASEAPYKALSQYDRFYYNGKYYLYIGTDLKLESLSGQAHYVGSTISANIGNLVQGSYSFKGTGPLE